MPPKHIRQTGLLLFGILLTTVIAFSQKKPNPKIGKNETEISSFILADNDLAFGAQLVYRMSVMKKLKIGAGIMYGTNDEGIYGTDFYGYGAVFADVMQFLGERQKWSFGGQIGHGTYNHDYGEWKVKAGIYYSMSCNFRAIVSKKLLFNTSFFIGHRNFHVKGGYAFLADYTAFMGLKFGLVF